MAHQNPVIKMSHSYHCSKPVVVAVEAVTQADSEGEEEEEEEVGDDDDDDDKESQ